MPQMIILLQPKEKRFYIQIGAGRDYEYGLETFNLCFESEPGRSVLRGFQIPCLSSNPIFQIYGDRDTRLIARLTKVLPELKDKSSDIIDLLDLLAKKFKVKEFQLNVNSNFDWSNTSKWTKRSSFSIAQDMICTGFSLDF